MEAMIVMAIIQAVMYGVGRVVDHQTEMDEWGTAQTKARVATRGAIGAEKARSTQAGTAGAVGAPAGTAPSGLYSQLANIEGAKGPRFPWMDLANMGIQTTGSMYAANQQLKEQAGLNEMWQNLGGEGDYSQEKMIMQLFSPKGKYDPNKENPFTKKAIAVNV